MNQWILASALLLAVGVAGAESDTSPAEEHAAALREAEAVGRELFAHETAQRAASESARRVRGFRRDRAVAGVLSTRVDDRIEVEFVVPGDDGVPQVRYRAIANSDGQLLDGTERLATPEPLPADRARAFDVRQRAASYPFERCGEDAAVIVLPEPGAGEGALRAYTLASAGRNAVAAGGNHRMDVAADGSIVATRKFTNTCIQLGDDPRAVALTLTHLLDPHPTEIHVLLGYRTGKALYLLTTENEAMWAIENGAVRWVDRGGDGE
ncbi:hypothetical protein [Alkalisalibacterium limincola]|uniref:PepSY domain-containing protein n=1 Tax=Alkalisalibacterium limincola TaxID=2699169 RepID=A0A5C8KVH4_9GAMM|nr:hypothetical protein [Alkalisalibacterium limincola]TXK64300.1 hypothetical protein FU658_05190 [Alkalisalibacterium limincola]